MDKSAIETLLGALHSALHSEQDIDALVRKLEDMKTSLRLRNEREAKAAIMEAGRKYGFAVDIASLVLTPLEDAKHKPRQRSFPRFRHPDNENMVWTGRGRAPLWVKHLRAQGREPVDSGVASED